MKMDYGFFSKHWAIFALQVTFQKVRVALLYIVLNVSRVFRSTTEGSLNTAKSSTVFIDACNKFNIYGSVHRSMNQ
jgi:hypothetical protein